MATFQAANTSFSIPNGGEVFIPLRPQGIAPIVYIRDGNNFSAYPLSQLVQTYPGSDGYAYYRDASGAERRITNAGQVWEEAINIFRQKTGQDYYSLNQVNIADVDAAARQTGGVKTLPSIDQYIQTKSTAATGGDIDISQGQRVNAAGQLINAQGNVLANSVKAPTSSTTPTQNTQTQPNSNLTPVVMGNGQTVYVDKQGNFFNQSGQPVSNQTVASSTAGSAPAPSAPKGNDLNSVMEEYLKKMEAAGMQINPNITIDAATLQEFATLAAKEIDPYYAEQLKVGVSDFLRNSGFSKDQLLENEKRLSQKYGAATRQLGEQAADRGFAQSGVRQRDERELALDTQNQVNDARTKFQFDMGTAGRNFEQKFGTSNVPGFSLGDRPTVGAGENKFGTSPDSPLYSLSDSLYQGIKGSNTFEQDAAKKVRQSQLAEGYRSGQSLSQIRSLTI